MEPKVCCYNHELAQTPLFHGCDETEIEEILSCLDHEYKSFHKGEYIFHRGEKAEHVCLVLSGSVQIETIDVLGNTSLFSIVEKAGIFAEAYAVSNEALMIDAIAQENSEILMIHMPTLLSKGHECTHSLKLVLNLLDISSNKNLKLSRHIIHSSPKTIRARLNSYFAEQGSSHFHIPLNRQQLADYLGIERTALSKELGKMKKEGILDFHKNEFIIKEAKS